MKKTIAILCAVLFFGCKSKPIPNQDKINVLFIGNSLTYFHDMPTTLQSMLNEKHYNFNIEQSTFDGMTLSGHLTDMIIKKSGDTLYTRVKEIGEITETEKKIASKKWDIIILQEGSMNHYFPDVVKEFTEPTIKKIKKLANKDCKFIVFNTWVSKGKYPREKECIAKDYFDEKKYYMGEEVSKEEKFCSLERLNLEQDVKILSESFDRIKKEDDLTISNHCQIHYNVRKKYPEIELYDDNANHPSEAGSFLNACVFYNLLTGGKASKLKFFGKLNPKTAKILKKESE